MEALQNHQKLEVVVPDEVATSLAVLTGQVSGSELQHSV
jgi:hypothetical protein